MTEAQKVAFDAVSAMLKKAGIPVRVISNEDMEKVACAFPQLTVKEAHQEYGADEFVYEYRVFTAPDLSADTMRWNSMESYYLIGVSGDFYIIMNSEETIGYIPQDWLWEGNG